MIFFLGEDGGGGRGGSENLKNDCKFVEIQAVSSAYVHRTTKLSLTIFEEYSSPMKTNYKK